MPKTTVTGGQIKDSTIEQVDIAAANGQNDYLLTYRDTEDSNLNWEAPQVPKTRSLTMTGTANQVVLSAGAQDLQADRTWTYSLPQDIHTAATPQFAATTIVGTSDTEQLLIKAYSGQTASNAAIQITESDNTELIRIHSDHITNLYVGRGAGKNISIGVGDPTTGSGNTFIGADAGDAATNAYYCVAVGNGALGANTTGYSNVAVGWHALDACTTVNECVAVGQDALGSMATTANARSIAIGHQVLPSATGAQNTAVGYKSMFTCVGGNLNTAFGYLSLYYLSSGTKNVAIGYLALQDVSTHSYNTAVGYSAALNVVDDLNVAIGYNALFTTTTGSRNTVIGSSVMNNNTYGDNNTAIGYGAGYYNTTGRGNVYLGYNAGYNGDTTVSDKLYIHNANSSTPLIYGDFDNGGSPYVTINGDCTVTGTADLANITCNDNGTTPDLAGNPHANSDYYGGDDNLLGDPTNWLTITVDSTLYRIPLFDPPA